MIHYTFDGSVPSSKSPVFDPLHALFIAGYEGNHGLKAGYTIRAVTMREGHPTVRFRLSVLGDRRDRTAYVSEEVLPGVRMVRDSDNDKFFLLKGTKEVRAYRYGMGRGALKDHLSQFIGRMPIEVIFTHNHDDHIG